MRMANAFPAVAAPFFTLLLSAPTVADAQGQSLTAEEFEAKLGYRSGQIDLENGLATLNLPPSFRFIGPQGSAMLLEKGWGNPPGSAEGVLGMLIPTDLSPLSDEGWGVIITYDEDGYVDDKDAESIDYAKLLKEMQEATEQANKDRLKQGYTAVHLVGWAERPSYNQVDHKLYWAKELAFTDAEQHTLNYNVRVLGRRGVLILNAVSGMDQLDTIKGGMQQVLGFVAFNDGHKYSDFLPGSDKTAAYGIAGLIAGAAAAKAGLFKVLLAGLLAAKKLIIAGLAALAAFWKRLFKKREEKAPAPGA